MHVRAKLQSKVKSDTEELQKILAGKSTLKTVFSSKSKDHHASENEKHIAQVVCF